MKDKEIRERLVEYLISQGTEMRIYCEKSIGRSICDLMVVTDKQTGYEIKSDSDSYQRLKRQVPMYDIFFDENYLVVGKTHRASAAARVPDHWGIICVETDSLTVIRKAKPNKSVSRISQLSVLWRAELKNILVKNKMTGYARKSKYYIESMIIKQVDDSILQKQTAFELLHREYSVFPGAKDRSIYIPGSTFNRIFDLEENKKNKRGLRICQ